MEPRDLLSIKKSLSMYLTKNKKREVEAYEGKWDIHVQQLGLS